MVSITTVFVLCLLGVVSGSTRHDHSSDCNRKDQDTTKACLDAYFKTYGFDSSKGLPKFADYIARTASVLGKQGISGFDLYCDYEHTLESCLGNLIDSSCMKLDGFKKMYGIDKAEAMNYATSYPVEAYTCQNKDLAKSYMPCTYNISQHHSQGLADCAAAMQKDIKDKKDVCVTSNNYVSCMENYYVKFCDEGIRSFICSKEVIALNTSQEGRCREQLHKC